MSAPLPEDGWVSVKGSKGPNSRFKGESRASNAEAFPSVDLSRQGQNEVECTAPKPATIVQKNSLQATTSQKVFNFNWADDVEEELFGDDLNTVQHYPRAPSAKQDECIIDGERYRYAPGASRNVPAFSIQTLDRRYEYEGSVSPLGSQPTSPADSIPSPSVSFGSRKPQGKYNNPLPVPQTSVQKQIWGKPAEGKSRRRTKKHNQPTPPVRPSWEFYEAEEHIDPFTGELPNAKNLLERVDPPVVEEDLWADFKKKPPRPIYFG